MDFGRVITAMATPFQNGEVDVAGIHVLVDYLIENGTSAIVACGTTGESPTLAHEEKLTVLKAVVEAASGRIPVIAGTGGNDTKSSVQLSKEAHELGVDGLLLVAPYYNRPTQEGLFQHFSTIANAVPLPVMLYNIPGRSAVNIEVDTVLRLAEVPNITSVKEASGNVAQAAELCARKPDDFFVYCGEDKLTLPLLSIGAHGVVSVSSHVIGPEIAQMIAAYRAGDVETAAEWSGRLYPVHDLLFKITSPAPVKAALEMLGLPSGGVRLPLVEASESLRQELRHELMRVGKLADTH